MADLVKWLRQRLGGNVHLNCLHLFSKVTNNSVKHDRLEMLCALKDCVSTPVLWIMSLSGVMIRALLHRDHSHTLSNGLNELTKYTERSTLNINQGLRASVCTQLCRTRSAAKDALAVIGRRKNYIHVINNQSGHSLSWKKQAALQFTRKWIQATIRRELPKKKKGLSLTSLHLYEQPKLV